MNTVYRLCIGADCAVLDDSIVALNLNSVDTEILHQGVHDDVAAVVGFGCLLDYDHSYAS